MNESGDLLRISEDDLLEGFNVKSCINNLIKADPEETKTKLKFLETLRLDITAKINDAINRNEVLNDFSYKTVENIKSSLSDFASKIDLIKNQTKKVSDVISEISSELKPLDYAKTSLHTSVHFLTNFRAIVESIEDFERTVSEKNFVECTNILNSLNAYLEIYQKYLDHPKFKKILDKFNDRKNELKELLRKALDENMKYFGTDSDSKIEETHEICNCITAFNDDFEQEIKRKTTGITLQQYSDSFRHHGLSDMKERLNSFIQTSTDFQKRYSSLFPESWRIIYHLALHYCEITSEHIISYLDNNTPNNEEYIQSFDLAIKFEEKMAKTFTLLKEFPFDPNQPEPEFSNDAEGIANKYKWKQRMLEKRPEVKEMPATEFYGKIASSFAKYFDIYRNYENDNLRHLVSKGIKNVMDELEDQEHVLTTATTLVHVIKAAMEKCAGFRLDSDLIKFYSDVKNIVMDYCSELRRQIPDKVTKTRDYQLVCCCANTNSYFLTVILSLRQTIIDIVSADKASTIGDDNEYTDHIRDLLKKELFLIIDSFIKENEASLQSIATDANMDLPEKLLKSFEERFQVINIYLSLSNVNIMKDKFCKRIVDTVRDAFCKYKNKTELYVERLPKKLDALKKELSTYLKIDSSATISSYFENFKCEIFFLNVMDENVTTAYLETFLSGIRSRSHFESLLKIKGFSQDQVNRYLSDYDSLTK